MATTLDLPLPLNISGDICSEYLKTSTSNWLKKIIQLWQRIFNEDLEGTSSTHRKFGHELCSSQKLQLQHRFRKTSDFPSNIWKSKKMKSFLHSLCQLWSTLGDFEFEPAKRKQLWEDKKTLESIFSSHEKRKGKITSKEHLYKSRKHQKNGEAFQFEDFSTTLMAQKKKTDEKEVWKHNFPWTREKSTHREKLVVGSFRHWWKEKGRMRLHLHWHFG